MSTPTAALETTLACLVMERTNAQTGEHERLHDQPRDEREFEIVYDKNTGDDSYIVQGLRVRTLRRVVGATP